MSATAANTAVALAAYEPRPIAKRKRRTGGELDDLKSGLVRIADENKPCTCRQIYYQAVSAGLIEKTEPAYKLLIRLLGQLRRSRDLPFGWIADNTRWMRKPRTYSGLENLLNDTAALYRRNLWDNQKHYVEIWLEKDALSGVLLEVTSKFDVPLMVTRGYPSITFLHSAAESIAGIGKPAFLYYFGDHDPSGIDIPAKVEAGIREFAPDADVTFRRVAVDERQIEHFHLPTRPTKKTDSRSKGFVGESVEVDAIPPRALRMLAQDCIESHIDPNALAVVEAAEASERGWLTELAKRGVP